MGSLPFCVDGKLLAVAPPPPCWDDPPFPPPWQFILSMTWVSQMTTLSAKTSLTTEKEEGVPSISVVEEEGGDFLLRLSRRL